jgi:hypothetical protein
VSGLVYGRGQCLTLGLCGCVPNLIGRLEHWAEPYFPAKYTLISVDIN